VIALTTSSSFNMSRSLHPARSPSFFALLRQPAWRPSPVALASALPPFPWNPPKGVEPIFPSTHPTPHLFDPTSLASVRSNLGCEKFPDRIFGLRRSASRNLTPPTSERADTARIRGIGRHLQSWGSVNWFCCAPADRLGKQMIVGQ
jgi:hypothetical protein